MASRLRSWSALLAAGIFLSAGCRAAHSPGASQRDADLSARSVSPPDTAAVDDAVIEKRADAHAHYASGVIHELEDEPEQALEDYYQAAVKDPGNEDLVLEVTRRFLQARQWDKALEILTRATARPDASAALLARLGFVYTKLDKVDLATKANRMAIKRDPRALVGYQNLFLNYLQNKRSQEALAVLDEAAAVSGTTAEFLVGLGELYANFGMQVPSAKDAAFAKAIAVLEKARQAKIIDLQVRLRLADGLNLLGKDAEAAQIYDDLLSHLPDLPYVRENIRAKLADIYLQEHDSRRAREQLEAMIRDDPTDAQAYYSLGSLAYDDKKFDEAADNFSKTLLLDPAHFARAYYDLAQAQIAGDKADAALSTLSKARQVLPQSFFLEYMSGVAWMQQKDFTNATSHFMAAESVAKATDTNALSDTFYFQFGAAYERRGDYPQAEDCFQKCLKRSPNFAEALNYLGYMWVERGEKLDQARDMIARALKAEPKNAAYLDSMGWALYKLHRSREALGFMLQAVQCSEQEDSTIYDHLGDIYASLGDREKANEAWKKSVTIEPNDQVRKKLQPSVAR